MKSALFLMMMLSCGVSAASEEMTNACRDLGYDYSVETDEATKQALYGIQFNKLAKKYGDGEAVPDECTTAVLDGVHAGNIARGYEKPENPSDFVNAMDLCFEAGYRIQEVHIHKSDNYKSYHKTLNALEATNYREHPLCTKIWRAGRELAAEEYGMKSLTETK